MFLQSRYEYDPSTDLLGKGGFARVYKARDTLLDRNVAIKIFNNTGNQQYTVLQEIKKVIQFEHPNLLRYYDVILLNQENALGEKEQLQIGVMEYANAGDLKQFATQYPNSLLLFKFLHQVLTALEYLHKKGIIHRDLKAQNVLIIEEHGELTAKLSDFGISKDTNTGTNSASMMVGTIEYMAPEQFSPQKYGIDGKIGSNVDLWSFGIMVHELITQTTPFGSRGNNTTAEQIMSSILSTEQPKDFDKLPEPYRTVVKKCLVANAKERIRKASELIQYFDNNYSPSKTTHSDNQTIQEQATKVYGNSSQSTRKQGQEDKTKVYGKQSSDDNKTKEYSKDTSQKVGSNWYRSKFTFIIALILLFSAVGAYWKVDHDKTAFIKAEFERQQQLVIEQREAEAIRTAKLEKEAKLTQAQNEAKKKIAEDEARQVSDKEVKLKLDNDPKQIIKKADYYYYRQADNESAFKLYLKAADLNDNYGQYMVGRAYIFGLSVKPNKNLGFEWISKAIDSGWILKVSEKSKWALDDACYLYRNASWGGDKNYKQKIEYAEKALSLCKQAQLKGLARNIDVGDIEKNIEEYKSKLSN